MKNIIKYFLFAALMLTYAGMMTSCGSGHNHGESHDHPHEHGHDHDHSDGEDGHDHSHGETDQEHGVNDGAHGEGVAFTSAFVCPMHCEGSGSDEPGTCPACKMDYVALVKHTQDGHRH